MKEKNSLKPYKMRLIKNADVLLADESEPRRVQVLFDEHEILEIKEDIENMLSGKQKEQTEITDAKGLVLLPGLVDTHVHLREPGYEAKETIKTGTRAAAHGGFTTIFAMPNVLPFPSTLPVMEEYKKKIEQDACIRVIPFATITKDEKGKEPVDYQTFKETGTPYFSDDGVGVQSDAVMEACMKQAAKAGVLFSCHTEDMNCRKPGACVHESPVFEKTGWTGIPGECESEQLKRDLKLIQKYNLAYHADHISSKLSVEALKEAKKEGADVSAEVTAHHLLLCDKDVKGPNWKMNPPLRSEEDRQALIEGLENGTLDFIANDHAPHTHEEKTRPMDKAPFGIVSLETSFPLLYTEFVARSKRWSLSQLVDWMSAKPAERFGLERTGRIEKGARADLVLCDLNNEYVIDASKFESKGRNTPFDGYVVQAAIKETIYNGKTVWKEGD